MLEPAHQVVQASAQFLRNLGAGRADGKMDVPAALDEAQIDARVAGRPRNLHGDGLARAGQ